LIVVLLAMFVLQAYSQYTPIGNTINNYSSITTIHTFDENSVDSVEVVSLAGFDVGDTVMIYCMNGADISLVPGEEAGADAQTSLRNRGEVRSPSYRCDRCAQ